MVNSPLIIIVILKILVSGYFISSYNNLILCVLETLIL